MAHACAAGCALAARRSRSRGLHPRRGRRSGLCKEGWWPPGAARITDLHGPFAWPATQVRASIGAAIAIDSLAAALANADSDSRGNQGWSCKSSAVLCNRCKGIARREKWRMPCMWSRRSPPRRWHHTTHQNCRPATLRPLCFPNFRRSSHLASHPPSDRASPAIAPPPPELVGAPSGRRGAPTRAGCSLLSRRCSWCFRWKPGRARAPHLRWSRKQGATREEQQGGAVLVRISSVWADNQFTSSIVWQPNSTSTWPPIRPWQVDGQS